MNDLSKYNLSEVENLHDSLEVNMNALSYFIIS